MQSKKQIEFAATVAFAVPINRGLKREADPKAGFVGYSGERYAWLMREGLSRLAVFVLCVLDLAAGKGPAPRERVFWKYKGTPTPENLRYGCARLRVSWAVQIQEMPALTHHR